MARGNGIIVSTDPKGKFAEGLLITGSGTVYPGTIMERDPTVALVSGRHTYKVFTGGADGVRPKGAYWVCLEDHLQGKTVTDGFTAGARLFLYSPLPGDELNLLIDDVSGTADDHTAGEILIVQNATGRLIATTGSPESEPVQLLETITDPTTDTLAWCCWTGH